jgi:hypothetical protein
MSKVTATYSGFVGHEGVPVWVTDGDEYEADHPLVQTHPELFTKPPAPKQPEAREQAPAPKPPAEPTPPAAPKRGPGRPPGAKTKAKNADG